MAPELRLDIGEDEKKYVVTAEMPGVKKEDIMIGVDGREVTIEAESRGGFDDKKNVDMIRTERYEGRIKRSFVLPHEVDADHAEAAYADGILKLKLPKKEQKLRKQLTVH